MDEKMIVLGELDAGPLEFKVHAPGVWIAAGLHPWVWSVELSTATAKPLETVAITVSFDGVVDPPLIALGKDVEQAMVLASITALAVLEEKARATVHEPREIVIERGGLFMPPDKGKGDA
jgi:hypothetical protein